MFFIPKGLPRWPGETVAILGGGPSLTRDQVDACRGRCRVIAINRAYQLAPWADMLHAHDASFWQNHPGALDFAGVKTTGHAPIDPSVMLIKMTPKNVAGRMGVPFSDPMRPVHAGRDSGYQAEQIAALLGAARVLLLGMDARSNGHWHAGYAGGFGELDGFEYHILAHRQLAPILAERGCEVVNCSHGSAIDAYPKVALEDVLP